ncbi:diacylglycerol kinase family lipid kinase [bacterium]|nr:diacylglycerol kinase family lipid kinase [bacterium]
MSKTIIIVNPAAARGALEKAWKDLSHALKGELRSFNVGFTRKPGEATSLVRKALKEGYEKVISVGGDGTLRECLNGFYENEMAINPKAILGILPFGRGSDLARALGISRDPAQAIKHLSGNKTKLLDVGVAHLFNLKHQEETLYFLNNAYVGIGVLVDQHSNKAPRWGGAKGAYMYGLARAFIEYRIQKMNCRVDGKNHALNVLNLVIANGPFYGAGMYASPMARLNDGIFDVVSIGKFTLARAIRELPRLYSGQYLKLPEVKFYRGKEIELKPAYPNQELPVDMDGDTVGYLPGKFTLLPKAIRFKV